MNGVLVIDKPAGPTSHDVVARVRRATAIRRVGHTGTLDPLATGVLPLVLGRATRLARLLSEADKAYDAVVRLGTATDSYDAQGQAIATSRDAVPIDPASIARGTIEAALDTFRGTYLQAPPPFSAKKIGGVRAYALARRREPVQPAAVTVSVHRLDLLGVEGTRVELRVVCSAGFYVRSLAHGLGAVLGCGAHLEALRRTRSGEFGLDAAVPLDAIEQAGLAALDRRPAGFCIP
ncbi:MAG: tRNA pseudouridine(55) synthase TruB [Acidobacteria bacterium]|nr:tRNA pseudouridine(55) synthase TruB [Acidobacteriota bacterium]